MIAILGGMSLEYIAYLCKGTMITKNSKGNAHLFLSFLTYLCLFDDMDCNLYVKNLLV